LDYSSDVASNIFGHAKGLGVVQELQNASLSLGFDLCFVVANLSEAFLLS